MLRTLTVLVLAMSMLGATASQRGASQIGRRDLVGRQFDAVVTRVGDGDTVDAAIVGESRPIRIRIEGVDAPEQGEAFSREALTFLRTLVFDQQVRVIGRELDRYGRLVARIRQGTNDVSAQLVRAGLACHAYAYDAALAREESQARAAGAGFWSAPKKPACVTRTAFSRKNRGGDNVGAVDGGTIVPPNNARDCLQP